MAGDIHGFWDRLRTYEAALELKRQTESDLLTPGRALRTLWDEAHRVDVFDGKSWWHRDEGFRTRWHMATRRAEVLLTVASERERFWKRLATLNMRTESMKTSADRKSAAATAIELKEDAEEGGFWVSEPGFKDAMNLIATGIWPAS